VKNVEHGKNKSAELGNTEGKQESEETGFRWMNSISVKAQGLFGMNVEQEVNQKDIETEHENESEKTRRVFNICPNLNCEQHIEDNWKIRAWELNKSSQSKESKRTKAEEYKKLKEEMLEDRIVTNIEYDINVDVADFELSEQTSEQSNNATITDRSTASSTDENETTNKQTDNSTGFSDRVRNWWADNRVREWVSRGSDDTRSTTDDSTDTNTVPADPQSTENQSKQTTNEQTSLWEYSADTQVELSEGTVGQQSNNDIDTGAGMSSSTSESEDFDNDCSNSI
jgi:hypothetical protein